MLLNKKRSWYVCSLQNPNMDKTIVIQSIQPISLTELMLLVTTVILLNLETADIEQ